MVPYPPFPSALISLSEWAEAGETNWSWSAKCTRRNGGRFQNCHGGEGVGGPVVPASREGDARSGAFSSWLGGEAAMGGIARAEGGGKREMETLWTADGR